MAMSGRLLAMVLTGSTATFAEMRCRKGPRSLCFVGASAAFVGVAITAAIPVPHRRTAPVDVRVGEDATATAP